MVEVTPEILKAAKLFVSKDDGRHFLRAPWVQKIKGRSIIVATDGHTVFVAEDPGKNYPRKPEQICSKPTAGFKPVDWAHVIRQCGRSKKKPAAVWFNPRYIERVARAAKILGVTSTPISLAAPFEPATFHLGTSAMVVLMPMRKPDSPHLPLWLSETVAPPAPKLTKKAKATPKAKRARQ